MKTENARSTLGFSEAGRSALSLLLFIHLFLVFAGLLGNESIAVLANRLRGLPGLSAVSHFLNLDPQFRTGFQLTHGMDFEDDHLLVVTVPGEAEPRYFPPGTSPATGGDRTGFARQRWITLVRRAGMLVANEDDEGMAELARAIGSSFFSELPADQTNARPLVLECRRYTPQGFTETGELATTAAQQEARYEVIYTADILRDTAGVVRVTKRVSTMDAAPLRPAGR